MRCTLATQQGVCRGEVMGKRGGGEGTGEKGKHRGAKFFLTSLCVCV